MRKHKHCRICQTMLIKPKDSLGVFVGYKVVEQERKEELYYKLEVCEACLIKEGIKSLTTKKEE